MAQPAAARPPEERDNAAHAAAAPAAAAGAAAQPEDPLLQELLDHFKGYLAAGGSVNGGGSGMDNDDAHDSIDLEKARNVLDAAAGNVQLAAQLYLDDYIATATANAEHKAPSPRKSGSTDGRGESEDLGDGNYSGGEEYDDDEESPHRNIRRSLDREFGRALDQPEEEDDEDEDDDDANMDEDGDDDDDDDVTNQRERRRHNHHPGHRHPHGEIERPQRRNRADMGGSVSVSDDETGGGGAWRIVGSMVAQLDEDESSPNQRDGRVKPPQGVNQRIRDAATAAASEVLKDDVKEADSKRSRPGQVGNGSDADEDDYISDSDWLEDDTAGSLRPALDLLWGGRSGQPPPSAAGGNGNVAESNVIADDDDADEDEQESVSGIPHTWLKASFNLSSCGTGLELKAPKLEDMELYVWRQQQNEGRNDRNVLPPPYHCKAVTALLSVVTAMLYTGASIQGNEVNCTSSRKPFMDLSEDDRKREFETRLADALSALIFIAANASTRRKEKAIRRARNVKKLCDQKLKQMERKLFLIPTCRWRDDSVASAMRQPEGHLFQHMEVMMSFTNVNDIRAYVLSTMRSFLTHGGVALLLETILRIHGKGTVARMVARARRESKSSVTGNQGSLISCSCEDRKKKFLEANPLPVSARNDSNRLLDPTPSGHVCMTVELMSLLLTGRVHATWKGWSTKGLNFGILSTQPGIVGWQLARPEKPIWILRGEACYSVAWLTNINSLPSDISKLDRPATPMLFTHWNCWYGQRNKSTLRLNTAAARYNPPELSKQRALSEDGSSKWTRRNATDMLLSRRKRVQTNIVSSDEHDAVEKREITNRITEEEMAQAKPHPEDKKFYPGKYQMWRFDMGKEIPMQLGQSDLQGQWVPYHRLSARDKLIVERKLGPKIKTILWTRWPGSTIDNFDPSDGKYPIV